MYVMQLCSLSSRRETEGSAEGMGKSDNGGSSAAEPADRGAKSSAIDGNDSERRYARDGMPYNCDEFRKYYGERWGIMWSTACVAPPAELNDPRQEAGADPWARHGAVDPAALTKSVESRGQDIFQ